MGVYFIIFIIFTIIALLFRQFYKKSKVNFDFRQYELEKSIALQNDKLKKQKEKTAIVDDFKSKIKSSNEELLNKIVDLNHSLFEEVYSKK